MAPVVRSRADEIEAHELGAVAFAARDGCDGATTSFSEIARFGMVGRNAIDLAVDHEIERLNGGFVGGGGAGILKAGNRGPRLGKGLVHCLHPRSLNDRCDRSD